MKMSVDIHEPQNMVDYLRDLGWEVRVEHLKVADYVRGDAAIERKDINDAVNSIRSGRLWEQLINMKNNYTYCYLGVSGRTSQIRRWQDIRPTLGAIARVVRFNSSGHGFGIPILPAENDRELAYLIHSVLKDVDETKRPQIITRRPHRRNNQAIREDMFCSIHNIGLKTVQKLFKELTLQEIILGSKEQIQKVIGDVKGNRVYQALHGD